jgi:hypothetical protein
VLNRHSYGRQLGRISDVLAVLVAAQPKAVQQGEAATEFLTMKREIDAIKTQGAGQRIEQLAKDVERLLAQGDAQLEHQLRQALQRVLAA